MSEFNVKIKSFEGPLDLLLFLIKKHKLDIFDIEISILLEQYLNYINELKTQNLELSSEFLEIAAQLIYIKTASLLPQKEEAVRLKEELTGKLLELEQIKNLANRFSGFNQYGFTVSRKPQKIKGDFKYNHVHDIDKLVEGYITFSKKIKRFKAPPKEMFSKLVETKIVSVTSRVVFILRKLYNEKKVKYEDFLNDSKNNYNIATFLAILELVKAKRISFSENNKYIEFNNSLK